MIREPRSEFVGRDAELRSLEALIEVERLVTLVGVGGVGKTRLAIRAANGWTAGHDGPSWIASLDTVADPGMLPMAVVRALGLGDQSARTPREIISDSVADTDALIVLDNCEHLIDSAARFVDELLDALPRLRVLATSRRPLELAGEHVFSVPPLSLASDADQPSDAVALLMVRARSAGAASLLSDADRRAALNLCQALDGLPLAIELAATRMRTMALPDLLERLSSRFALLQNGPRNSVERQRTLRAVVDWSYELCTPEQRELWEALSVFSGSVDLAAVAAVADLNDAALVNTLDQLVAQSVVEADHDSGRFRMLETVRRYGIDRAQERGTWPHLVRRHLDHIRRTAADQRRGWWGPGQAATLARLRADRAELQSALTAAVTDDGGLPLDVDAALELFADLRYHWAVGGFVREGRGWSERLLALPGAAEGRRLPALITAAWLCLLQGDLTAAAALLSEAESLVSADDVARGGEPASGTHQDASATIELHRWWGTHAMFSGDPDTAQTRFERSIRAALAADMPAEALLAQFQLTTARSHAGRADAAGPAHDALLYTASIGETWMRSHALWALSLAAFVRADLGSAEQRTREAIAVEAAFDDPIGTCLMLEMLAWIDARRGSNEHAAMLLGAAATQWRRIGSDITAHGPQLSAHHEACVRSVRGALGARLFARISEDSARLTPAEAIALSVSTPESGAASLSRRERDVAAGIHRGLSNREIADELVLSTRTVDTHVQRIFAKLGVASRAQVAAWYESVTG